MKSPTQAPDQAARDRVRDVLDETLFVEAGAGSGKTTALVERVVALVESGVAMRHIAAITFTEKAATELRDRIRDALEQRAASQGGRPWVAAVHELDAAAIGTLHSFAQRILTEHAITAGLPPRFEVLDEVSSGVAFDARWERFVDRLLDDDSLGDLVVLAEACKIRREYLRDVARVFDANWDLLADHVPAARAGPDTGALAGILDDIEAVAALGDHCTDPADKLLVRLGEWSALVQRLRGASDLGEAVSLLTPKLPSCKVGNIGRASSWTAGTLAEVRKRLPEAGESLLQWLHDVGTRCLDRLGAEVARFTLEAAEQRRRSGRLEFHDLLVLARQVMRDPGHGTEARAELHDRYRRLLLDEFQDTDPIQIELAVLMASDDPDAGRKQWTDVRVVPGRLFFVGDPKQSIYRFRRADIDLFMNARDAFGPATELTANFRSGRGVLTWVNAVFGRLIESTPGSQPAYIPLDATCEQVPRGPAVACLGSEPHPADVKADEMREAEARDVVAAVRAAIDEGWSVRSGESLSQARLGDITILLPARTSLPALEDALEAAGVPYRTESSSLVYATRAIRDLVTTVRSVDDPTDELATVTALRSRLFGCGDDDLYRWKHEYGGSWNHQAAAPESIPDDDPVGLGMAYLRALHRERLWLSPSELLGRIVEERRLLESGFADGRPRDLWRRVRFVVDQARAWCDAEGGSVRDWLGWVARQADDAGRVAEVVLAETDDDSVRIMTIHAAKGLEFPITILSGMSTRPRRNSGVEVHFPPGEPVAYKVGQLRTDSFERARPLDEQMSHHERIRLLYVACTRARDHLVVSLHRKDRKQGDAGERTNSELIAAVVEDLPEEMYDLLEVPAVEREEQLGAVAPPPPLPAFDEWLNELRSSLDTGSLPHTVAATMLTERAAEEAVTDAGLAKAARDLDLPPWRKGRYGTAVGRAVHGVLQTVDLESGEGIEAAVAAQAAAEGILGSEATIDKLARAALASPTVREAAASNFWRETYVAVPVGETTLEGYIDLLYRGPDGLVIVDYKTAGGADHAEIEARLDGYRLQGGAYALAVAEATGEPASRCVFVFLTEAGAVERELDDLNGAVTAARAAVTDGSAARSERDRRDLETDLEVEEPRMDAAAG